MSIKRIFSCTCLLFPDVCLDLSTISYLVPFPCFLTKHNIDILICVHVSWFLTYAWIWAQYESYHLPFPCFLTKHNIDILMFMSLDSCPMPRFEHSMNLIIWFSLASWPSTILIYSCSCLLIPDLCLDMSTIWILSFACPLLPDQAQYWYSHKHVSWFLTYAWIWAQYESYHLPVPCFLTKHNIDILINIALDSWPMPGFEHNMNLIIWFSLASWPSTILIFL